MHLGLTATARPRRLRAIAGGLLLFTAACAGDPAGPATTDPVGEPALALLDGRSGAPGIVFGSWNMTNASLNAVHTGWMNGGPLDPANILTWLAGAKAKNARVIVKLCKGRDAYVQNADGTFNLTKWKSLVSRYRSIGLGPYIADGTILAHMLIDEPHLAARWGGRPISPATLEAMAKYSKEIWPSLTTVAGEEARWLASSQIEYRYLDASWPQYTSRKGDAATWIAGEIAAAERKGLGVIAGMNVMDGGNGSSGIRGRTSGKYAMSASEVRSYGSALVGKSYVCAFFNWTYDDAYYGRTDVRSAMGDVSAKARSHAKTACRQ